MKKKFILFLLFLHTFTHSMENKEQNIEEFTFKKNIQERMINEITTLVNMGKDLKNNGIIKIYNQFLTELKLENNDINKLLKNKKYFNIRALMSDLDQQVFERNYKLVFLFKIARKATNQMVTAWNRWRLACHKNLGSRVQYNNRVFHAQQPGETQMQWLKENKVLDSEKDYNLAISNMLLCFFYDQGLFDYLEHYPLFSGNYPEKDED